MTRRIIGTVSVVGLAMLLTVAWTAVISAAEDFPTRPIKLVCPFSAGGSTDTTSRMLAEPAGKILGKRVVVENKRGAGGSVALTYLNSCKPDGYIVGMITSAGTVLPLVRKTEYHPIKSFDPLMQYSAYNYAIAINAELPFKSLADVIKFARENPGKFTYGAGGHSNAVLQMENIALKENVKFKFVNTGSGSKSIVAAVAGHIMCGIGAEFVPQVKAGKLRALAIIGTERVKALPDVPTIQELGYPAKDLGYIIIVAPKGVPQSRLNKLHNAFRDGMKDPAFIDALDKFGMKPIYKGPTDAANVLKDAYEWTAGMAKKLGWETVAK